MNYYNDIDPKVCAWTEELIKSKQIPDGKVDCRPIDEVTKRDIEGFTQCHWFNGISGWAFALRLAGWREDRPVWVASCPCQPFSSAGKGKGKEDERHLWPHFFRLIRECRPPVLFGEQVENAIGHGWLDLVAADLEGEGYAVGAVVLGAHSVGAPHRRQRLWFVADAQDAGRPRIGPLPETPRRGAAQPGYGSQDGRSMGDAGLPERPGREGAAEGLQPGDRLSRREPASPSGTGAMADAVRPQRGEDNRPVQDGRHGEDCGRGEAHGNTGACCEVLSLEDPCCDGSGHLGGAAGVQGRDSMGAGGEGLRCGNGKACPDRSCPDGPGFWDSAEWLPCLDGKLRKIEPGIFPLADGLPRGVVPSCDPGLPGYANSTSEARVMRLKGYGNSVIPQVAAEFVKAFMEYGNE